MILTKIIYKVEFKFTTESYPFYVLRLNYKSNLKNNKSIDLEFCMDLLISKFDVSYISCILLTHLFLHAQLFIVFMTLIFSYALLATLALHDHFLI